MKWHLIIVPQQFHLLCSFKVHMWENCYQPWSRLRWRKNLLQSDTLIKHTSPQACPADTLSCFITAVLFRSYKSKRCRVNSVGKINWLIKSHSYLLLADWLTGWLADWLRPCQDHQSTTAQLWQSRPTAAHSLTACIMTQQQVLRQPALWFTASNEGAISEELKLLWRIIGTVCYHNKQKEAALSFA